jgi:hypothetical protein
MFTRPHGQPRRGSALIIVLALLTLFMLLALTFVLYASREAEASRVYREAESTRQPDVRPDVLLTYFLNQLIYDTPDDSRGAYSVMRGHSLARLLYGWDAENPDGNSVPFNGTGRLHEPVTFSVGGQDVVQDGYGLVNYTCFQNADGSLRDGFLRDPERLGQRAGLAQPPGPFTGGFNAAYTYPDLNNMFLAAVNADGNVLLPSFHRPWTGFGPLDPNNPNWYDTTKPWLKYQVLRPRPADMGPGFPPPAEAGGDVKNLTGYPGGNDSVWLDLDFPVLEAPDGRKFKPLFAPLITDLDNRVNLNVHGNVRGSNNGHASNQGWGPWKVNLAQVLTRGDEWKNLFLGRQIPPVVGRYGRDGRPGSAGQQSPPDLPPHTYAQMDFDGSNETAGGQPTGRFALPGQGAPPLSCFPAFPAGYGNGSGGQPGTERWEHPLLYNSLRPTGDDRSFDPSNVAAMLCNGAGTPPGLTASDLFRLCPANFADPRTRRLVTTLSADLDRPSVIPWLFDRDASAYVPPLNNADQPPTGPPVAFPALALRSGLPVPLNSEFRVPGLPPDNPRVDWRSADAALGRVDLNRFLPPYPHQGRGSDATTYQPAPLVGYADRFDTGDPTVRDQFLAAQAARQALADDVYRRLLAVAGVAAPADPAHPTDGELVPRRWLAQLAANVVDFLDEDDISTPFNFYTANDAGDAAFDVGAVSAHNPELPRYRVFGTELPRVVVNEVLTEYQLPTGKSNTFAVRVWVELFNPLPAGPLPPGVLPEDAQPVSLRVAAAGGQPGYSPYQVVLANTNTTPGGPLLPRPGNNDNVLGAPDIVRAGTSDQDFAGPVPTVQDPAAAGPASVPPQGFFLLGPPGTDARQTIAPPRVPGQTPWLHSSGLEYPVRYTPPDTLVPDDRPGGVTVLLRRLVNPHLPSDPRPTVGGAANPAYNPYLTVDYLDGIPLNNATSPNRIYTSRGKQQPYAADPSQVSPQAAVPGSPTWHTLGLPNDPLPASGHYDWLVHLDRPLVSPMELLHVSGHHPHQLTHRFISRDNPLKPVTPFNQRVPWFDQSNRLYRVFEYLEAGRRSAGVEAGDRTPGKLNLNTVWDPETFRALCDPQPGNGFSTADVDDAFARLLALRTPGGVPGPGDRPFLGMAVGYTPAPGDAAYPDGGPPLFPAGSGINDTLLRSAVAGGDAGTPRLFQVPGAAHPYLGDELLFKIFDRVTTRSNVFAVWLTVGFFEVTDPLSRPMKLGGELNVATRSNIRHRMFAIVDRSVLRFNPGPQWTFIPSAPAPGTGTPPAAPVVQLFYVFQ